MKIHAQKLRFAILTIGIIVVTFINVRTISKFNIPKLIIINRGVDPPPCKVQAEPEVGVSSNNSKDENEHEDEDEHPTPNQVSEDERPTTHAVIHMGIHKTGSTSIQRHSQKKSNLLKMDGYYMPWLDYKENHRRPSPEAIMNTKFRNQSNFATCFTVFDQERVKHPCDPDLLLHGIDIAKRNHNLFVSAETFSKIDKEGVDSLATYLSHWDEVTIVIYYRRFYSWIASVYNQITKMRQLANTQLWETSILEFVTQVINDDSSTSFQTQYTKSVVKRVRKRFDNVVVVDYHDDSVHGAEESLFCHVMPNAKNICKGILSDREVKGGDENNNEKVDLKGGKENKKVDLEYGDLAYGAMKAGLIEINSDERMKQVTKAIQNRQEIELNLKSSDFKRICLPPEALEKLWEISVQAEKFFFPERSNNFESMQLDFNEAAHTTLCKLDVENTLKEWEEWFTE